MLSALTVNAIPQDVNRWLSTLCTAFERYGQAKRARLDAGNAMAAAVQSEYQHLQRGIASTSRKIEAVVERVVSEVSRQCWLDVPVLIFARQGDELATTTDTYYKAAVIGLSTINDASRTVAKQGVQEDVPTGMTPRKRSFEVVDRWELTKSREVIVKGSKKKPALRVGDENSPVVHGIR